MTDPSQYFKGRTVQEQMDEVIGYVDTRAAEVATTAIAADVAQVHQDMLDADADAAAAAASAAAAAGTLANAVKKTGEASQSIAGDIAVAGNLTGGSVTVPAPVNNTDAASKKYVDDQDALDVHLAGNQNIADVKTFSSSPIVPTVATGTADTKAANGNKVKNELDNYAPMVRTTGNQTIDGTKSYLSRIIEKATTDWSVNGFVSPMVRTLFEGDDRNNIIMYENSITKESANSQRQDIRQRVSKDGTNNNRIDVYFRTNIDAATETVTLQLFILVYENGVQVRSKSQQIASITAV